MLDGVVSIRRNNMLIKNTSISIKYKKIDNLKKIILSMKIS